MNASNSTCLRAGLCACLFMLPTLLVAAERRTARVTRDAIAAADTVEMFAGMKSGDIEVKLIPKDDTESRVLIKNNTKRPLNVRLPDAFAGVPVLAQFGGGIGGGARPGGVGGVGGGQQQSMGGGMGGGMGMMNIPAEKVGQLKVPTVCLEHGKKIPHASIPYEIKPIEAVTSKPEVKELLTAFGKQRLGQRATQAAAWHIANEMSWDDLANKKTEHLDGSSEIYFSQQEIQSGVQIANDAATQAALHPAKTPAEEKKPVEVKSPGEDDSNVLSGKTE